MNGGAKASRNGPTSARRSRSSAGTISRACRSTNAITTCWIRPCTIGKRVSPGPWRVRVLLLPLLVQRPRLLEEPIEPLLRSRPARHALLSAWANAAVRRAWDGGEHQVLMPQSYGEEADWRIHFEHVLGAFRDSALYPSRRQADVLDLIAAPALGVCAPMLELWRELARRAGLNGLHIVGMLTGFDRDPRPDIFDAFAEFEPMYTIRHGLPVLAAQAREVDQAPRDRDVACTRGRASRPLNSYDYASLWRVIAAVSCRRELTRAHSSTGTIALGAVLERSLILRNFDERAFESGVRAQVRTASGRRVPVRERVERVGGGRIPGTGRRPRVCSFLSRRSERRSRSSEARRERRSARRRILTAAVDSDGASDKPSVQPHGVHDRAAHIHRLVHVQRRAFTSAHSLDSLLAQTHRNLEIVAVDDCSDYYSFRYWRSTASATCACARARQ